MPDIKKLYVDKEKTTSFFPLTHIDAVFDSNGNSLSEILENFEPSGDTKIEVINYTSGTTIETSKCYNIDASSSDVTITLPRIVNGATVYMETVYLFVKTGASNTLTIRVPVGGDYPEWEASNSKEYAIRCLWDGVKWVIDKAEIDIPSLPYDAEIEWIKSDSNGQYIDTGIECVGDLRVRFVGMVHDNNQNTHASGGMTLSGGSVTLRHHWTPYYDSSVSNRLFYEISSGGLVKKGIQPNTIQDKWYDVTVEPSSGYMTINGGIFTFTPVSSSLTTGKGYGLFARIDNSGNVVARPSSYKLLQMWKDGDLVRDCIPVRIGQVGYLYDKVTGQFLGNATAGSFIIGNDVSYAYDAEVEYLASSDASNYWIDTGVVRPSNFESVEIEVQMQFLSTSGRQIMGAQAALIFGIYGGQWEVGYNRFVGTADTNVHIWKKRITVENGDVKTQVLLDNEIISDFTSSPYTDGIFCAPIGLFNYADDGQSLGCYSKIYYSKLRINGEMVRDYIPVRVGQVGYMFDKVTNRLYGNYRSQNFTIGSDVTP